MLLASVLVKWEASEFGMWSLAHRGLRLRPGGNLNNINAKLFLGWGTVEDKKNEHRTSNIEF